MMSTYGIGMEEACVEGITARDWKKKVFLGVGILVCIVAIIIIGIYTTYHTGANQLSNGVSAPEETDMRIDVNADDGLAEPQGITSVTGSDSAAPSGNQQDGASQTNPNVEVRVNGTPVNVPNDGSVHKVINTENGSTTIDVSTQSNVSSGDSRTRSSLNVDIDSSSRIQNETRE